MSVLGTNWRPYDDTINIRFHTRAKDAPCTLRTMLPVMDSFYDVLGLFGPLITRAKILFQAVQTENSVWDDLLPEKWKKQWRVIEQDLLEAI